VNEPTTATENLADDDLLSLLDGAEDEAPDEEAEAAEEAPDEEAEAAEATRRLKKRVPRRRREESRQIGRAARQQMEEKDQTLLDFLAGLGTSEAPMRIFLDRRLPKTYEGPDGRVHNLEGRLDRFDEPITEEDIRERFGGGTYVVVVQMPNQQNKYVYTAQKTLKIAGPPKLPATAQAAPKGSESETAVKMAMDTMRGMIDRSGRTDPAMEVLVRSMQEEMRDLRRSLSQKDNQILELVGRKPEASTSDRLLETMLSGESVRLEALRAQHESELRAMRERLQTDADRQFGLLRDQLATSERQHERELQALRSSFEFERSQTKLAHDVAVQGYQRELAHLDRLLNEAKTELAALRAEKTKTPLDMLGEISTMKEAFEAFGGGGEEKTSVLERVVAGVMSSPLAEGIAGRIASGPPAGGVPMQPGPAPMSPPVRGPEDLQVNQPHRLPDGRVVVKKADGRIVEVRAKKKVEVTVGDEKVTVDPTELKAAVKFMETAFAKGQDPATFASAVRHSIPPSIQRSFAGGDGQGVDRFLDEVADLDPASPLSTQAGRTWLRTVATHVFS